MKQFQINIRQFIKMLLQKTLLPLLYKIYTYQRIEQDLVIFADAHHNSLPFSMKHMHDAFKQTDYKVKDFFLDFQNVGTLELVKHIHLFMKYYAKAKYVFICDYYLPVSSSHKRKDTRVIQLWHACGCLKKFGYSIEEKGCSKLYSPFKNYDLITVSSPYCVDFFAEAMGYDKAKVLDLGISRTDLYFQDTFISKCKEKFKKRYPQAGNKKIVLWAPTFRGNAAAPYCIGNEIIDEAAKRLEDKCLFIKKLHPHMNKDNQADELTSEELLPVADILITDYSSLLFDFSLQCRPIILFAPDHNNYNTERGFYINYPEEIPAPLTTSTDELYQAIIEALDQGYNTNSIISFKKKYMSKCDGSSTKRILKEIETKVSAEK